MLKGGTTIILLAGCLVMACKKEEQQPVVNPASNSFRSSPYTITDATEFYGIFASSSFTMLYGNSTYKGDYSSAYFSNAPSTSFNMPTAVKVNEVSLNSEVMKWDTDLLFYRASTPSGLEKEVWRVSGANGIPSFNFTSYNNAPNCSSFDIFPDSISKSAGFTVIIKGVVNITPTGYELSISDGSNSSLGNVSKPIYNGDNVITFSPAELMKLNLTNGASIGFSLENVQSLNFYGKNFKFIKVRSFSKSIIIKT
jgi:hypothetical protein